MHLVRAVSRSSAVLSARGARALSTSAAMRSSAVSVDTSHGSWFLERGAKPPHRMEEIYDFLDQDVPMPMHEEIARHRTLTMYARLVENELPRLSEFVTPFRPPGKLEFLRLRIFHNQGYKDVPDVLKARLDFPVDKLFASGLLPTTQARKKFLQLAGQRWDPSRTDRLNHEPGTDKPPYRSLTPMSWGEVYEHGLGWVKIACVRFPNVNQNIKWVYDRFDEMIAEANREPYFDNVPVNIRHVLTPQAKKSKLKRANGPTYRKFPQTWLPEKPTAAALGGYSNQAELTAETWRANLHVEQHNTVPENVVSAGKLGFPVGTSGNGAAARALAAKKRFPWTPEEYNAALPGSEPVSAQGGRPNWSNLAVAAPEEETQPVTEATTPEAPASTPADDGDGASLGVKQSTNLDPEESPSSPAEPEYKPDSDTQDFLDEGYPASQAQQEIVSEGSVSTENATPEHHSRASLGERQEIAPEPEESESKDK